MAKRHRGKGAIPYVERWELERVREVAFAFETPDREELQAELSKRLAELKRRMPRGIKDWEAYMTKFLYNKAENLTRNRRARDRIDASLRDMPERVYGVVHGLVPATPSFELASELAQAWDALEPKLQHLWQILIEEEGNQAAVARRLGIHRNTVRIWLRRIRQVLKRHGF